MLSKIYRRFGIYSASFHRCDGAVAETFVVYPLSYREVCFTAFLDAAAEAAPDPQFLGSYEGPPGVFRS